jgi:ABC-type polar amino acid transport system ATPase subunit
MVVVSHEMHFVRDVASRVIFMDDGLFVEDAPPAVMFTNPQDERTRQFLTHIL